MEGLPLPINLSNSHHLPYHYDRHPYRQVVFTIIFSYFYFHQRLERYHRSQNSRRVMNLCLV